MNRPTVVLIVIFALFFTAAIVQAATDGFVPLFDGKTLSGWTIKATPKDKQLAATHWKVDGGTILADSLGHKEHDYVWLASNREYSDFTVRLRFQVERGITGNSGIQIRSRYDHKAGWMNGPQIDINPAGPWRTGMIWDETKGVQYWLYPKVPKDKWVDQSMAPKDCKFFYADEHGGWNDLEIKAEGLKIRAWLNGIKVTDYDGTGVLGDKVHQEHGAGQKGIIALQIHAHDEVKIRFKDIRIKPSAAGTISSTPEDMAEAQKWVAENFGGAVETKDAKPFFSFTYDGKQSAELLNTWKVTRESQRLDDRRTQHMLTYTDPKSHLTLRCVGVAYSDYPTVEWTIYLKNHGTENTSLLENIRALDVRLDRAEGGEFVLRGSKGDSRTPDSYQPYEYILGANVEKRFAPVGGRPTNGALPYYNVQKPGGGLIIAVGWPGQWATTFTRDGNRGLQVTAGQETTHLYLKPGEEIRTPLIAMLWWKGLNPVRAQNLWRRWMFAHNLPRIGDRPIRPLLSFCCEGLFPGLITSEADERRFIDAVTNQGIPLDYWWVDAGWYRCKRYWPNTGTWEVDTERFPRGLKAISDYVHAKKMGLIVWFEPERVRANTWLSQNHPEWLLAPGRNNRSNLDNPGSQHDSLLNLGNPDARNWLIQHIDTLISEQGIDFYRQDFNFNPLGHWRNNDAKDRQGITEIKHVTGYLAYWDELRRRHPNLLIDSCAGGGRRNDLETLRRAVPLLRSDYQSFTGDPDYASGNQCHTYGLASWIPYFGQGVYFSPQQFIYSVRSYMCPAFALVVDVRKGKIDWDLYRRLVDQWRQAADCFLGDYYPLTPYSLQENAWMAWQFNRPESGKGVVQAFRRSASPQESLRVKLYGLDTDAIYRLTNLDSSSVTEMTGGELCSGGFSISIADKPGSAVITYNKISPQGDK